MTNRGQEEVGHKIQVISNLEAPIIEEEEEAESCISPSKVRKQWLEDAMSVEESDFIG